MKKISPQIQKELISILYQNLLLGFVGISLISVIIVWQLKNEINVNHLFIWFVLLNLNLLGGVFVTYWYRKTSNKPSLQSYHYWAYILGSNLTALLFGILGSFLMPNHIAHQLLVILVILSIAGASVQNLHASYLASGSYLSFTLIPLILWEVLQAVNGHHTYIAVLAATLIFMMYLIIDVYSGYAMLENNIKLKIDNIEFARTVSYQKNLMELLSTMLGRFQRSNKEQEIYDVFYDTTQHIFKEAEVLLFTCNLETNRFTLVAKQNIPDGSEQKYDFAPEECFAVTTRAPHYASLAESCKHFLKPNRNSLCIPLLVSDDIIGIICLLVNRELSSFELNFIYRLASGLALGINNLRLREGLNKALVHDALTKLYNRYYLDSNAEKLILEAQKYKKQLIYILLDLDYFKTINDTYGHYIGDIVLINFSKKLKEFFSDTELVFRYGGEEFLIILDDISLDQAIAKTNAFRESIKSTLLLTPKYPYKLSISGGIAAYPANGNNFIDLINSADSALYMAKKHGRDQIVSASKAVKEL